MDYQIMPIGEIWQNGMFSVPEIIAKKYIKMASEYQLKALLLILSENGIASGGDIAKTLGCTENDADDFLGFWVEEGILIKNGEKISAPPVKTQTEKPKKTKSIKTLESLPVPTLSPKDIVASCRENPALSFLLQNAQEVLGKTLSHSEQELIINMTTYYGLPGEVVLTILQYCKSEKEKGKALGTAYIAAMAKNWSEEGITTLSSADEKLKELESSNRLWDEIVSLSGIRHRNPTVRQREMIKEWKNHFSFDMIALACDIMKENAQKPTLKYVDSILKNWIKKGIKTPEDAEADSIMHNTEKESSKTKNKYKIDSTYDIDEIAKKAMFKEDYDF